MSATTEQMVNQAVMGDSEAIHAIAAKIDSASPQAVANYVSDKMRFERAAAEFQSQYRDIWGDDILRRAAISRDVELANAEPQLSYEARLEKVGTELRQWAKQRRTAAPASEQAAPRTRRSAVQTVVDGDDSDDSPAGESAADTSRIIQKMAQARGARDAIFHPYHEFDQRWPGDREE